MSTRIPQSSLIFLALLNLAIHKGMAGQDNAVNGITDEHRFFDGLIMEEEDDRVAEELNDLLDRWLEHPLCLNSGHAILLAEHGLISMYQFHKLNEYRMIYGDLLSVYELKNVEGWDPDIARKVAPYLTAECISDPSSVSLPHHDNISQQLVLKTTLNPQLRKGFKEYEIEGETVRRHYLGSPLRLGLRYDLNRGDKLEFGLRLEKDQGEPLTLKNELFNTEYHGVDHLSAYLKLNFRGIIRNLVIGDYRLIFGYGLNYSGGKSMAGNREGLTYPAHRFRANTSMSESGFLRGSCVHLVRGKIGLTGFISFNKLDGTSIDTDSTGKPVSFSSIDVSGLHRSATEINQRKLITEQLSGGHLVFVNNWLKAGLIGYYNRFNIPVGKKTEPYATFRFTGRSNLVSGLTLAVWLRDIRFSSEFSISRNRGFAMIAGAEFIPSDGFSINLVYRKSGLNYQNLHSAEFSPGGSGESGLQTLIRLETGSQWLVMLILDIDHKNWVSYQLNSASRKWQSTLTAEKSWKGKGAIYLSAKYRREILKVPADFSRITHPVYDHNTHFRIEGRYSLSERIGFKTRIESAFYNITGSIIKSGWLFMQDVSYSSKRFPLHCWMRICFFESEAYETRLYAYENDVLYDFSSFMHDGKGLRSIFMMKYSPCSRMDFWLRASSVTYCDRPAISSGWDQVEGNRLWEIDLQLRFRI